MMKRAIALLALSAGGMMFIPGGTAQAVVYCEYINYPVNCVARPGVRLLARPVVGAPGVVVRPGVGVGAPGVGVRPGTPANRGGPVNRPGRR